MRARVALAAVALAAAPALAACGGSAGSDAGSDVRRIEREIQFDLQEQSGDPGIEVECPRSAARSSQFECYAVDSYGDEYTVLAEVDRRGDVLWEVL